MSEGFVAHSSFSTFTQNAVRQIAEAGLRYPILCKSVAAHGSDAAHEMHIVFHDAGLADVPAPYVAQQFINHNAVIYKVSALGRESKRWHLADQPHVSSSRALPPSPTPRSLRSTRRTAWWCDHRFATSP